MQIKFFIAAILLIMCNHIHAQSSDKLQGTKVAGQLSYGIPNFEDPERVNKIKLTMQTVDRLMEQYAKTHHLPGMSYGILVDGVLIHKGSLGYADIAKKTKVSSSTMFRMASMSKSFATMAILRLRDESKLQLDDPAEKYISILKNLQYPTSDSPKITIRDLMTHGAGFPEDNPWGDRQLADTDSDFMKLLGDPLAFSTSPGTSYEYSNLGFALLGKIITVVSGSPYQKYVKDHILTPLGMAVSTYEYADIPPARLAHGYRWLNDEWSEETLLHDTPDGSWGAMGSLISSVDEFSKYLSAHMSAWPASSESDLGPIKRSSMREMHHPWRINGMNAKYKFPNGKVCPSATAYCYGLNWLKDCEGKTYVGHSGGLPGFGSQWRFMPEYGIGIVSFANRTYAPMTYLNLEILDTIVHLAGLKERVLPESDILKHSRIALTEILPTWDISGKEAIFAENFFDDYPMFLLKDEAAEIFKASGKIQSVSKVKPLNHLRGSFTMIGTSKDIEVFFTLSPEHPPKIQELRLRNIEK